MNKVQSTLEECQVRQQNQEAINLALSVLPNPATVQEMTDIFQALSNPARLKLLLAMSKTELCVCDCAEILSLSFPATSQHLKHLRLLGVVGSRQDGKMVYYKLINKSYLKIIACAQKGLS